MHRALAQLIVLSEECPQQLLGAAAALIAVQCPKCLYRPRNSDTPGNTLHTHVTPISHCDSNTSRTLSDCLRLTAGSLRWLAGWVLAGLPINRPLFFDFPADPNVWEIDDVYMFGPTMLAAPVTDMGARTYRNSTWLLQQYCR